MLLIIGKIILACILQPFSQSSNVKKGCFGVNLQSQYSRVSDIHYKEEGCAVCLLVVFVLFCFQSEHDEYLIQHTNNTY